MRLVWFTWKDIRNPLAGGAEAVSHNLASRLVKAGHEVVLLTAGFKGSQPTEEIEGYKVVRCGGRWTVYWYAWRYYRRNLQGWPDAVIEEINTVPFFTALYVKNAKRYLLFHQLCREIWFYQMFFPLNVIGYLLEPIYLRALSKSTVITISNSTKNDLIKYGFDSKKISTISLGLVIAPINDVGAVKKYESPTLLSLGAIRPMKRPLDQVKAFECAKRHVPDLKLKIAGAGSGEYFGKMMQAIKDSPYADDIEYLGRVDEETKIELMRKCWLIMVTSVKEGWGLIVTEANSQGTPAVVYNVDGLCDAVKPGTGMISKANTPQGLSECVVEMLQHPDQYAVTQKAAWEWSRTITFERSAKELLEIIG